MIKKFQIFKGLGLRGVRGGEGASGVDGGGQHEN